jgi:hypothetical protein
MAKARLGAQGAGNLSTLHSASAPGVCTTVSVPIQEPIWQWLLTTDVSSLRCSLRFTAGEAAQHKARKAAGAAEEAGVADAGTAAEQGTADGTAPDGDAVQTLDDGDDGDGDEFGKEEDLNAQAQRMLRGEVPGSTAYSCTALATGGTSAAASFVLHPCGHAERWGTLQGTSTPACGMCIRACRVRWMQEVTVLKA